MTWTGLDGRYGGTDLHGTLHLAPSGRAPLGQVMCLNRPGGVRGDAPICGAGPVSMLRFDRVCGMCADQLGVDLVDCDPTPGTDHRP